MSAPINPTSICSGAKFRHTKKNDLKSLFLSFNSKLVAFSFHLEPTYLCSIGSWSSLTHPISVWNLLVLFLGSKCRCLLFLWAAWCFILLRGGVHCRAPHHSLLQQPSCPAHRSPPETSAELGESKPGGGRAADLDDWSDRSPVSVHFAAMVKTKPKQQLLLPVFSPLNHCLRSRRFSFQVFIQPIARIQQSWHSQQQSTTCWLYRLRAPAAAVFRETVSTSMQPMSLHEYSLPTGSYRSACSCQYKGLMTYSPEGQVNDLKKPP